MLMSNDVHHDHEARLYHISKNSGARRFGIKFSGNPTQGFIITSIDDGSPASLHNLQCGDKLLEVNGQTVIGKKHMEIIQLIFQNKGEVKLLIRPASAILRGSGQDKSGQAVSSDAATENEVTQDVKDSDAYASTEPYSTPQPRLCYLTQYAGALRGYRWFGFFINHDPGSDENFIIERVQAHSVAALLDIRVGDRVIEINGLPVRGKCLETMMAEVKQGRRVSLLLADSATVKYWEERGVEINNQMKNIRICKRRFDCLQPLTSTSVSEDEETKIDVSHHQTMLPKQVVHQSLQPRLYHGLKIMNDYNYFGFIAAEERDCDGLYYYVSSVEKGSEAARMGIKLHDRIVEVNGENQSSLVYQGVVLQTTPAELTEINILVADEDTWKHYRDQGVAITGSMPNVYHSHVEDNSCQESGETETTNVTAEQPNLNKEFIAHSCWTVYNHLNHLHRTAAGNAGSDQPSNTNKIKLYFADKVDMFLHLVCHKQYSIELALLVLEYIKTIGGKLKEALLLVQQYYAKKGGSEIHLTDKERFIVITYHNENSITKMQKEAAMEAYSKHVRVLFMSDIKINEIKSGQNRLDSQYAGRMWLAVYCVLTGHMCSGVSAIHHNVDVEHLEKWVTWVIDQHSGSAVEVEKVVSECVKSPCWPVMKVNNMRKILHGKSQPEAAVSVNTGIAYLCSGAVDHTDCLLSIGREYVRGPTADTLCGVGRMEVAVHLVLHRLLGMDWVARLMAYDQRLLYAAVNHYYMSNTGSAGNYNGLDISFNHLLATSALTYRELSSDDNSITVTEKAKLSLHKLRKIPLNRVLFLLARDKKIETWKNVDESNNWCYVTSILNGEGCPCTGLTAIRYKLNKNSLEVKVMSVIKRSTTLLKRLGRLDLAPFRPNLLLSPQSDGDVTPVRNRISI